MILGIAGTIIGILLAVILTIYIYSSHGEVGKSPNLGGSF